MYNIMLSFGSAPACNLCYKTKEAAEKVWQTILQPDHLVGPKIEISDDYGQRCFGELKSATAVFEDAAALGEAHIERALINARIQAKANKKAQTDSSLQLIGTPPSSFAHPAANGRRPL